MAGEIGALDQALARAGRTITLRRPRAGTPRDVVVRAVVRSVAPTELVGDTREGDQMIIMSPSEILAAGWPGDEMPSAGASDPSLPRVGDKVLLPRVYNIEAVLPFHVDDRLVRIELRARG